MSKMETTHFQKKSAEQLAFDQKMLQRFWLKDFWDKKLGEPCQGQLSTMGEAAKAMKSQKLRGILKKRNLMRKANPKQQALGKGKVQRKALRKGKKQRKALRKGKKKKNMPKPKHMKKPSAALTLPKNDEGLSLEEKMDKFHEKGGQSVDDFLGSLTQGQRECLWGRFSRARDGLKDPKVTELWNQTCKGKGSDGPKKQLLKIFLDTKGDLKKGNLFQKELIQLSQTTGGLDASMQLALSGVHVCAI